MSVYLDVGFISQLTPGNRDPLGCWYASACMVGYFFEQGPRLGVPELYQPAAPNRSGGHLGIPPSMFKALAKNEQLEAVPGAGDALNSKELKELLRSSGPLWFAWYKTADGKSYGHVSVAIGVDDTTLTYHDPEDAPKSRMSIDLFNARRATKAVGELSILRRRGDRTSIRAIVLRRIRAKL